MAHPAKTTPVADDAAAATGLARANRPLGALMEVGDALRLP